MTEKDLNYPNYIALAAIGSLQRFHGSFMEASQFNSHNFMTEKQSDKAYLREKMALNTSHSDFNL